jgi:hypothetical protein
MAGQSSRPACLISRTFIRPSFPHVRPPAGRANLGNRSGPQREWQLPGFPFPIAWPCAPVHPMLLAASFAAILTGQGMVGQARTATPCGSIPIPLHSFVGVGGSQGNRGALDFGQRSPSGIQSVHGRGHSWCATRSCRCYCVALQCKKAQGRPRGPGDSVCIPCFHIELGNKLFRLKGWHGRPLSPTSRPCSPPLHPTPAGFVADDPGAVPHHVLVTVPGAT